ARGGRLGGAARAGRPAGRGRDRSELLAAGPAAARRHGRGGGAAGRTAVRRLHNTIQPRMDTDQTRIRSQPAAPARPSVFRLYPCFIRVHPWLNRVYGTRAGGGGSTTG